MFDRKLVYTLISIGCVAAASLALSGLPGDRYAQYYDEPVELALIESAQVPLPELLVPRERTSRPPTPERRDVYILREYNGYIAVFTPGASEPHMVLDRQVRFLPDIDRMHLQQGITVTGRDELTALIEDYIS